jgi:hypothetical protein
MKSITVFLTLFILGSLPTYAQLELYQARHRPADLNWQELNTEHFRIIFPFGLDSTAFRAARILENDYPKTVALTGGSLKRFPVVLTNYNDLTNGFVTPINFRSEVDLAPFKGKSLNPKSGSWLETVLPHELVHANHANVIAPLSFPHLYSLFSPDYARSFNFFPPAGVHEGLAVHYESQHGISGLSGRSNYPYFTSQLSANLNGDDPWNMAQLFSVSDYTQPYGRHYIGGADFTNWLHQTYGGDISRRMIRHHQYYFFLGYGYSMRNKTGKWPRQLYNDFRTYQATQDSIRRDEIGATTDDFHSLIPSPFAGVQQASPLWISNDEILFFSRQYNEAPGYYAYNTQNQSTRKVAEAVVVGDHSTYFDQETGTLYFAEYFSMARNIGSYQTDLVALNVETGKKNVLTDEARLFSPQKTSKGFLALKPSGDMTNIVELTDNGIIGIQSFENEHAVSVRVNPVNPNQWAVLLNKRGVQAVWMVERGSLEHAFDRAPDLSIPEASIHDPAWHPSGKKILFTADAYPAMNVFEWDLENRSVTQLTNSVYNAFEASYMPDGRGISYITQVGNEYRVASLEAEHFYNAPIDYHAYLVSPELSGMLRTPFLGYDLPADTSNWSIKSYSSDWRWLKPRAVFPVVKEKSDVQEWGVAVTSTDVLQSQVLNLEATYLQDLPWYNVTYINKTFYPGFQVNAYKEAEYFSLPINNSGGLTELLQEERGISLRIPFEYYWKPLTRFSSLRVQPSISMDRLRFHQLDPQPITDYTNQLKAGLFAQLNLRLQQLPRDVQPSSGLMLYIQTENTLNSVVQTFSLGENDYTYTLGKRRGTLYGAHLFLAPLKRWNQSLRISYQGLDQSASPLFSTDSILPLGFSDDVFDASSSIGKVSTRYAIPLTYPDNGGFLLPLYLSNVYMTLYSHTLFDYTSASAFNNSRTILGSGLHFRFKISNLAFELGAGFAFDPTTNNFEFIFGSF